MLEVVDPLVVEDESHINNVSYDHAHEDEFQPGPTEDQHNGQPSNFLGFTPNQHKELLALLQQSSHSSSHSSDMPYNVGFYAKQKRLPFPNSDRKSVDSFDLVHMDIWGPLSIPSLNCQKYLLTVVDDKS
ncbi:hypothetical protein KIW84_046233 [Lathyrus oleraceus]|uniref:Uncharacterized protein n=1 Tax=Pisum sativum TaxID=3888 RepID=A0A9D4XMA2_PEA|nr:hypothetical protein KIW84_046233 [Pisum sativum]